MKENRNGFIFTAVLSFVGLIVAIVTCFISCNCANWLQNLGFALFGSAFISAIICLINYLTLRRKMFDEVSKCYDNLIVAASILRYNLPLQKEKSIINYLKEIVKIDDIIHDAYWKSQNLFNISSKEKQCKDIMYELIIKFGEYQQYLNGIFNVKSVEDEIKDVQVFVKKINNNKFDKILQLIKQWDEIIYSKKLLKIKQKNRELVEKAAK